MQEATARISPRLDVYKRQDDDLLTQRMPGEEGWLLPERLGDGKHLPTLRVDPSYFFVAADQCEACLLYTSRCV